ncbi:MAG: alpha/beta hydrolase [Planctomycetota bacterium]
MSVASLCLFAAVSFTAEPPEEQAGPTDPAAVEPATTGGKVEEPADPAKAKLPEPKTLEDGVRLWADLPFRLAGGEVLRMDLALPPVGQPRNDDGRAPLMVFVHGGAWMAGSKLRYKPDILMMAREGAAAASIEYRLSRVVEGGRFVAPFPAALQDVRAALAFLVNRKGDLQIDPERIALIGDSAGGHLSLLAALSANGDPEIAQSEDQSTGDASKSEPAGESEIPRIPVATVVNLFGVTDMPAYYTGSRHARVALTLFLQGHLAVREAAYRAASPVQFVDEDDPPVLTLHGTADSVVPYDQAVRLHAALKEAGVANELVPVDNGRHGLFAQRNFVRRQVVDYLAERLVKADDGESR